mmetsp:Transcript_23281/g.46610  ORF Transcript_23281/g.46610 Transcript_23281/m.46610 type:complete len:439 (+) Transcript_23281:279-1595(+)
MKFSSSIVSTAVLLGAGCSIHAFTTPASSIAPRGPSHATSFSPPSAVFSTTEDKTSSTTLPPDFQAARDQSVAALQSSLPSPSPSLEGPLVHFMDEYFAALSVAAASGATNPDGSPITARQAAKEMSATLQFGMKYGLGPAKFTFASASHKALRGNPDGADERYSDESFLAMLGPHDQTDFYAAGCNFFRPAMDLRRSLVLGQDHMAEALEQIRNGENVVFLANHQSEADPQVVSCLFETVGPEYGDLAAHVTYVAGHKVTTDPLAIPFSMGRNLLCIHSKKHIDADPETKSAKSAQNMRAMNEMLQMFKSGGCAIWVAPSGGRDRRNVETGKIPIAPFDQKTVDMFRLMGNKSKTPTHFYPMSMVSYDLCPPPDFVEAGVGEQRNVRFTRIGIKIGEEVPNVGGAEKRHLFTERADQEAREGYAELLKGLGMEQYIP